MTAAEPVPALRRNRNFSLLLSGSAVSVLGDRFALMAYPLLVLGETGSPAAAGWVGFAGALPAFLFYLPAAPFVERWDPRRTMGACEACRGLAVLFIVASLVKGAVAVPALAAAACFEGAFATVYSLAEVKMIRAVVPSAQTSTALAGNEARNSVASLVGRPFGGFLYGLGRAVPFLADVISFVISVTTLLLIRLAPRPQQPNPVPAPEQPMTLTGIGQGFRCVRSDRYMRAIIPLMAISNLIIQALYVVFIASAKAHGTSSAVIGVAFAATGIGGILGAATASRLFRWCGYRLLPMAQWVWVAAMSPLLVTVNEYTFGAALTVMAMTGVAVNVSAGTYFYQRIPEEMLARVMSVDLLAEYAAAAAGPLAGGLLVTGLGGPASAAVLAGLAAVLAAIATSVKDVRTPPRA